jgi:Uma2 family endonuclease
LSTNKLLKIGSPKQPTISIHEMIDGEYQVSQFTGSELIVSSTFPELKLTADSVAWRSHTNFQSR